jgi:uncharacterized protein (DUF2236 family)
MIVERRDLEEALARVRAEVPDPRAGIHGPGSAAWSVQKDAILFLGGGCAALLQLAHPFVAYAVEQHSKTREDVVGRFQRTFMNVFAMSFGDLDDAFSAARRVHNIHTRIVGEVPVDVGAYAAGTRYQANDVESLRWVHATLVHTAVTVRELVFGRMPRARKDAYVRESIQFARLFGIPDRLAPATWAEFDQYVAEMCASDAITVSPAAREMAGFLFGGRAGAFVRLMAAGMLPARLRRQYGLPWGLAERAAYAGSLAAIRAGWRALPRRARYLPAYVDARRRVDGKSPSALGKWMEERLYGLASFAAGSRAA